MDKIPTDKPSAHDDSRTLRRGLQVMDAVLAGPPEGLRVTALCRAAGLERATVYRLLATLQQAGYVTQVARFHYAPGERWGPLAPSVQQRQDLAQRLAPVLSAISTACGDAAYAVVREGGLSHCIARQMGSYPVQVLEIQVGTRQPLGVGAAGLALLSALSDREVEAVIGLNTPALPLYGDMTPALLRLLVGATRERGWSAVGNHATKGVLAVGMPVYDTGREPIAGISVATIEERMPKERQKQIAQAIRKALKAAQLSAY